ncbi:MAG: hypothetical protein V3T49_01760 [Dehalococcoidia bacterium]
MEHLGQGALSSWFAPVSFAPVGPTPAGLATVTPLPAGALPASSATITLVCIFMYITLVVY